jgi:hypothetical protein
VEPGSAVVDKGAGRGLAGGCLAKLSGTAKSLGRCTLGDV